MCDIDRIRTRTGEDPAPGKRSVRTALVVDGDAEWRRFACWAVGSIYPVLSASEEEEALRIARTVMPDLIVLHVTAVGGDGVSTFRRLRSDPATRHIAVVVVRRVSGDGNLGSTADDMAWRVDGPPPAFLEEPVSGDALREEVARSMQKLGGARTSQREEVFDNSYGVVR